jgi:hypothetical protein
VSEGDVVVAVVTTLGERHEVIDAPRLAINFAVTYVAAPMISLGHHFVADAFDPTISVLEPSSALLLVRTLGRSAAAFDRAIVDLVWPITATPSLAAFPTRPNLIAMLLLPAMAVTAGVRAVSPGFACACLEPGGAPWAAMKADMNEAR